MSRSSNVDISLIGLVFLASLLMAGTGSGETLNVPFAFGTIQSAIDASSIGDTVLVAPGTYVESVSIFHQLTLLSEAGPEQTTIDAQSQGTVVSIRLPAEGVVVEGFRIRGGDAGGSALAGGINVQVTFGFGWAIIRNNIIEDNQSALGTGGVNARRSSIVEDNIIQSNNTGGSKAEAALVASGTVRRNIIRNHSNWNHFTARILAGTLFEDNLVVDNGFSGNHTISFNGGGVIRNNTIANNLVGGQGTVSLSGPARFEFTNNIVTHGNWKGLGCYFNGGDQNVIRCNNVWGTGASYSDDCNGLAGVDGNISLDPLFCDSTSIDYRLSAGSPCAPANSPLGCGLIGALPVCGTLAVPSEASPVAMRLLILGNPVSNSAEFAIPEAIKSPSIGIYDSAGRLVEMISATASRVAWTPGPHLSRGVYYAELVGHRGQSRVKFVILR